MKPATVIAQYPFSIHLVFLTLLVLSLAPFGTTLASLWTLSLDDDRYSHTAITPLICASILYLERGRIFRATRYRPGLGIGLCLSGASLHSMAVWWVASTAVLSVQIFAVLLVWIGAFLICYGPQALRAAAFATLFLFLTIPLPTGVVDELSFLLQAGSAELSHALFRLSGVPVFRQGHVFSLPGLAVEVAEECSGIRSTTALFISSILIGYVSLRSGWRRLALVLATAFAALFKNALRIVFLSLMSVYVDSGYIHGVFHHRYGGVVFSLAALAMISPVFFALRRSERAAPVPVNAMADRGQTVGSF